MWLVGNLQANNSQLSVECGGESAKGRGVRRAATWLIFATWKFVNACQAKRRTPVNNSLTDFLTSWLSEWVSEWLTDALRMITEIACDCQLGFSFGYGFNQSENKTTKKKAATIFFATDALFMDPKQTRKRNSSLPVFHQFGSNCFCWWAWGQLADGEGKEGRRGVWRQSRWQQAEATLNRFRVAVWHLTDKLPQLLCRWRCRKDRWKRSTSCVHVAALSPLPGSPLNPRLVPTPFALTNVCRLLIEAGWLIKLANSRKAAAQKKMVEGAEQQQKKSKQISRAGGSGGLWGVL